MTHKKATKLWNKYLSVAETRFALMSEQLGHEYTLPLDLVRDLQNIRSLETTSDYLFCYKIPNELTKREKVTAMIYLNQIRSDFRLYYNAVSI